MLSLSSQNTAQRKSWELGNYSICYKKHPCPHCGPNSDSALSPIEVKNVHDKLLARLRTNVRDLQIWVTMLAGTKLFLRGDKTTKLRHEDAVGELTVFNVNGSFELVPTDVLGKEEEEASTTLSA